MKYILEKTKDYIAMIAVVLFQAPNKRFDSIVGSEKEKYEGDIGSTATVTEIVSRNSGAVRYSGATWRARLSEHSTYTSINIGEEVTIESAEGNTLVVL